MEVSQATKETHQATIQTAARHTHLQGHRATAQAAAEVMAEAVQAVVTAVAEAVAEVPAEEEDKTLKTIIS